ncbi:cyclase family protein [Aminivibrio sp.]|jgi:arylformamidase|uniref:cyclase family protein n=1 Tax=Aminivibrio sp. TaxID=1872489 RepID=UPI001A38752F|nr:cyclase family protein [Aminivibrio sp.]MBL3539044.1 cyclase family protein [Aminivibrio sp.]MDK2958966.1 arylformamidase [Synergistaceae bacterium]
MKCYDITRELLSSPVYPGDREPELQTVFDMRRGADFNLSSLSCSLHTGTHCDAFLHFRRDGQDIAGMPLDHFIGPCHVLSVPGHTLITEEHLRNNLPEGTMRLLLKSGGTSFLAPSGAAFLLSRGILTLGTDSSSVAPLDNEAGIHLPLLSGGVALIESLWLEEVPDGEYFLSAAPLKIRGAEGAPCRAVLFSFDRECSL